MAYKLKVLIMSDVANSIFEEKGYKGLKREYQYGEELYLCDVDYVEKTFRTKAAKEAFIDGMATIAERSNLPAYAILDNRCRWE